MTMLGAAGRPAFPVRGTSDWAPNRHPTQTGLFGSPLSNSTHTPVPIGGTTNIPIGGPVGPASGKDGSAQLDGTDPSTSGTMSVKRPRRFGSRLLTTVPR